MVKYLLVLLLAGVGVVQAEDVQSATVIDVKGSQQSSNTIKLAQNKYRNYLYVRNLHATEALYLTYSANVSGDNGVKIAAGSTYEPTNVPVDALYFVTGSSTGVSATVISGN